MPNRIALRFAACRAQGRRALIPFFTAGFPRRAATLTALSAADQAGCDLIEIGVPFSDPLADGPAIQRCSQAALEQGVHPGWILEQVAAFRRRSDTPVLLMGYLNPFLRYGLSAFCRDAHSAGVDGLIVPDLPPDEAVDLQRAARRHGVSMVFLIAPTTTDSRVLYISKQCTDFCYCVSLLGVTGVRAQVGPHVENYLRRVRRLAGKPIVVGFGIATPAHVRRLRPHADGLVVGSALVSVLENGGSGARLKSRLASALKPLVQAAHDL
jgi:tryptophan synthase alpha chain